MHDRPKAGWAPLLYSGVSFYDASSSDFPNTARIRNGEGLSSGADALVAIPAEGDDSALWATVSLNPANGPKVEFSFVDELAKTLRRAFTAAEVSEGKNAYLDCRLIARTQDQSLPAVLASHEVEGRTMQWDEQVEQKIQRRIETPFMRKRHAVRRQEPCEDQSQRQRRRTCVDEREMPRHKRQGPKRPCLGHPSQNGAGFEAPTPRAGGA